MELDALFLSRFQFGFTIAFHIIFPAFTIGLSAWIATLTGMWLYTKNDHYQNLARFWTKIFAVSFAMGVVSGIVLSYQFGTNWSGFSRVVGNVIGPVISYEVLTAFFLEASFLGVMLFGWGRVPPWLQFVSSSLVAFGTALSGFWILSANSWMQFPAGFELRDGIAYPTNFLEVIFNPTFPVRFAHVMVGSYLTTALVVMAVGARYLLENRDHAFAKTMLRMGLGMAIFLAPLQAVIGHEHGKVTAIFQPAKLAAMEGHWDSTEPGKLVLFGIPNNETERNDYEIAIPKLGSWIIWGDFNARFPGLMDIAIADRPPLIPVFFAFRLMVGLGLATIAVVWFGGVLWARRKLFDQHWFLNVLSVMWPVGFVAILAGWITTEVGRQPWVATGILRTADAVSPIAAWTVAVTLITFILVYAVIFTAGIVYLNYLLVRGPLGQKHHDPEGIPNRPISAAIDEKPKGLGDNPMRRPAEKDHALQPGE